MDLKLHSRVAMIAAASKGIGKACALSLIKEGASISICARNQETLEATRKELAPFGPVLAINVDVSNPDDLSRWHQATLQQFGKVDILITNTGGPPVSKFMDLTDDQWKTGIDSTLMNVIRLSRLVIPGMQERKWGRIIHLTSLVAKQPVDELTISSTLRAGISGLTKTMSNQLGPSNVTVNAILMGHILTDRQLHLAEVRKKQWNITTEEYYQRMANEIPLKRLGEAKEIGDVAAFLSSELASYITGVSLQIDGGLIKGTM